MMLMMDNKKLAQGVASKILKKSKENPEMLESDNAMDSSKIEVAKELMGAIESKDPQKFLSAFRALMLACESDEEVSEELEMPEDNYGDKLTKDIEIEIKK
jgi:hypothetical protein